ncbi:hypothetical protein GCM10023212_04650 [Luteolibacter yonseiensis]
MTHPHPDDSLLLIRCPSCGQRFKVGDDLRERTVECGGCEHRFRINDEVIVRTKKFYPGERNDPALNRFQRVPLAGGESLSGLQTIRYANVPDPAVLEPMSPQRILAGALGVGGMVFMALLLMFGGSSGGMLDGMETGNRLVMGGFACLLGMLLLVYANPKARIKALGVGLLLAGFVMAVPFFFKSGSVLPQSRQEAVAGGPGPSIEAPKETEQSKSLNALKSRIGTDPLDAEIARHPKEEGGKRAVGIWLRDLSGSNKNLVRDYFIRAAEADSSTHPYPRDGGYLLVVTGTTKSLQELAKLANPLGETQNIYPDLSVVEVRVNNENFIEGPMEKLINREDPAFYQLNRRELESVDLDRAKRAVQRLSDAPPTVYRSDITRQLISLLGEETVDFKPIICRALETWSEQPGPASAAALAEAKKLQAKKQVVPQEMIALIVKEKNVDVVPVLDELWSQNATVWEALYGEMGQAIEPALLRRFPETSGTLRFSAIRLMGRVGGADSLSVLATVKAGSDPELKILLERAEKSIKDRLSR